MRKRTHLFWMGSMLAGAVALGCQGTPPQPAVKQPRVRVTTGAMGLAPDTDMALQLQRTDCDGKAGYGLQQVADVDPRVANLKVTVRDQNGQIVFEQWITRAQFNGGCIKTFELTELPLGTYKIELRGYGSSNTTTPISQGGGTVTFLNPDEQIVVPLQCNFDTGKLAVEISCCPSTPTPGPSSTPTPSPTPTPTPSPVNPSDQLSQIFGFNVDHRGDLYLIGIDDVISNPNPDASNGGGRIAKVYANRTTPTLRYFDDVEFIHDIEIAGGVLAVSNTAKTTNGLYYTKFLDIETGAEISGLTNVRSSAEHILNVANDPYAAPSPDARATFRAIDLTPGCGFNIYPSNSDYNNYLYANVSAIDRPLGGDLAPISAVFRLNPTTLTSTALWTSDNLGIVTPGANRDATSVKYPIQPPPGRAKSDIFGLAPLSGTKYFVTFDHERAIYVWDEANPAVFTLAVDSIPDGSFPRFIHRAPDGLSWYVLTFRQDGPETGSRTTWKPCSASSAYSSKDYRIMRFESDGADGLVYRETIVSTYASPPVP